MTDDCRFCKDPPIGLPRYTINSMQCALTRMLARVASLRKMDRLILLSCFPENQ